MIERDYDKERDRACHRRTAQFITLHHQLIVCRNCCEHLNKRIQEKIILMVTVYSQLFR